MTNPQRGEVAIELGGQTHRLRISLNALAEAQELLGERDFNSILARLSGENGAGRADFVTIRALLAAALRDDWPDVTPKKVGALVGPGDLEGVMDALNRAMAVAFPPAESRGNGHADPPPAAAEEVASPSTGPT